MTKQEILDYLDNVLHPIVSPDNWNVYSELHDMIEELPSAEPVKHGKWVEHVDDRFGASHYFCSECGEKPLKEERTNRRCLSNFCPNCGARMDKE